MNRDLSWSAVARIAGAALLGVASGCATAGGVIESAGALVGIGPAATEARATRQAVEVRKELARGARKYVVVDLDENELRFMDGEDVLWSGPVGTGTGLRLRGEESEWDFSTPNGVFNVQFKEQDPVWILPDWYFVKNEMPIPPEDSPLRRMPGALGAAAVYLGDEIAIHGTDKPELLGQRVSHGCIRLADANAIRLFHNVQIGTPIIIVGGKNIRESASAPPTNPGTPPKKAADPATKLSTAQLLKRLDGQVATAATSSGWTETTSILIARGLDDDADALRGVLRRAGRTDNISFEREYATFVADAFARGSLRAVVSLARIDEDARLRAARAIVQATMDLYYGSIDDPGAPWPTKRVPDWRLGPEGSKGWSALRDAEIVYRQDDSRPRIELRIASR